MTEALLESRRVTVLDLLDRLLETGVVVDGEVDLSVADIDLIHLGLKLVLASSATLVPPPGFGPKGLSPSRSSDQPLSGRERDCLRQSKPGGGMEQHSDGSAVSSLLDPPDDPPEDSLQEPHADTELVSTVPTIEGSGECGMRNVECGFSNPQSTISAEGGSASGGQHPKSLPAPSPQPRINFEPAKVEQGLAKLVLILVELIRRLMEKQAVRKMEGGTLTETQLERLGEAFRRLESKMVELKRVFGLEDDDLNLDLGPVGKLM